MLTDINSGFEMDRADWMMSITARFTPSQMCEIRVWWLLHDRETCFPYSLTSTALLPLSLMLPVLCIIPLQSEVIWEWVTPDPGLFLLEDVEFGFVLRDDLDLKHQRDVRCWWHGITQHRLIKYLQTSLLSTNF